MEQNSAMVTVNSDPNHEPKEIIHQQQNGSSLKKGRRSKNIFKVALFMMRGHSRKSKVLAADEESKSVWRKLLGSMRPLHLQNTGSPQHNNAPQKLITSSASVDSMDGFESASESAHSPSPSSSRYASAVGLNELVKEEEEEEVVKENNDGEDGIIDAKAEEFITEFYYQMRLQRLDVTDRHYEEISMRSLGLNS